MKIKNYFFISLAVVSMLLSCCKSDEATVDHPIEKFNAEALKGEWVVKTPSNNFKKITIASDGSFNIAEVTQAWNVASPNNMGKWSVDETSKTLTGTYDEIIGGVTRAKTVSLSVKNQQDNSFEATATGEDASGTYKRLLGEVKLTRGESTVPTCLPELRVEYEKTQKTVSVFETREQTITWEETAVLTSSNPAIATVDSQTGLITAQNETGIAFVDIKTSQGTSTIKVIVDNGYESFLGKTRAEIHEVYGTGNIAVENISQIMYNYNTGDFKFLKFEFKDGKVLNVGLYFKENANLEKNKTYLDSKYNLYKQQDDLYAYINGETKETSTVGITFRTGDIKALAFTKLPHKTELFYDYSISLGKTQSEIFDLYSSRTEFTTDIIQYKIPSGYNDVVDEVVFKMNEGKCSSVLVNLQKTANEENILAHLNETMTLAKISSNGILFYSKDETVEMLYTPAEKQLLYMLNSNPVDILPDPFPNFKDLFGKTKTEVKNTLNNSSEYKYYDELFTYSIAGSLVYIGPGKLDMTEFVFNDDNVLCEYWSYPYPFIPNDLYSAIGKKYIESVAEGTGTQRVFYDLTKRYKIYLMASATQAGIRIIDLQQKTFTAPPSGAKGMKSIIRK